MLARWDAARLRALELFRTADPDVAVPWAAAPLKPRTLATTRLAEHWAHTLDIAGPLGLPVEDTDRLAHIARLAHRTLPYAFTRAGETPPGPVRFDLTGPDGAGLGVRRARRPDHDQRPRGPGLPHRGAPPRPGRRPGRPRHGP